MIKLTFEANKKSSLKAQIEKVNNGFTPESFYALYRTIKRQMLTVLFFEIEEWLLDLLKKEKLYVINGLLAILYLDINNFKQAQEFAYIARVDFPDTEIWDFIISKASQAESQENSDDIFG